MTGADDTDPRLRQLRELALVDRILGLEAQLAEVSTFMTPDRETVDRLEHEVRVLRAQLDGLHQTWEWRVGRVILAPARALKRALERRS